MTFRKSILLLVSLTMIAALVACSSTKTATTIAATAGTPQTANVNAAFAINLQATVLKGTKPVSGASVTFTAPSTGASGTFANATITDTETTNSSGVATASVFTANATAGSYTVLASVSGVTASASFSLTNGTAAAVLAPGNYVFSLSGVDSDSSLYSVAGVFTVDSTGATISGGEQDFVDYYYVANETGLNGGVVAANDGTGNLIVTLNTGDTCIGPGADNSDGCTTDAGSGSGIETLVVTMASGVKGVVAEYDTWATSSGSLDFQDSTAAAATPSAGYTFFLGGIDTNGYPLTIGGVLNVDGAGTISGAGSVFDSNDDLNLFSDQIVDASTVSAPDADGRVTFTLNPDDATDFPQIILEGYIVDSNHIRLVESDDAFVGTTGGSAYWQGANTGTFSAGSLTGNSYVISVAGADATGPLQSVALLTESSGSFAGFVNYNDLTGEGTQPPETITSGSYTVDSTGRVSIPGVTDGNVTFNLQLYLDGNGNAMALTLDATDVLGGAAFQQTGGGSFTAASFNGTYATDAGGVDLTDYEFTAIGPVTAGGDGTIGSTTPSAVDINWIFTGPTAATTDLALSGAFTADSSGVFVGTLEGLDLTTPANVDAFSYYLIDTTRVVSIEVDPYQLTLGYSLQEALGGGSKNKK